MGPPDPGSGFAGERLAIFAAPCDVLHIATFLRFCAVCDVNGHPSPDFETGTVDDL